MTLGARQPLLQMGGALAWVGLLAWGWINTWGSAPIPKAQADGNSSISLKPQAEQAWVEGGRSLVIYPPQALALKDFSHALHLGRGAQCADCHAETAQSMRASDVLLPDMANCMSCHVLRVDGVWACAQCHAEYNPQNPPRLDPTTPLNVAAVKRAVHNPPIGLHMQQAPLKFSHKLHADALIPCADCHQDLHAATLATRQHLPTMQQCWQCHTGSPGEPTRACNACHQDGADGRLTHALPAGVLVPVRDISGGDHRNDFLERHETFAAQNDATCAACHATSFCLDCHNGVVKPASFHPPNFAHLHGIEAQAAGSASCTQGCHNLQQFCESCHAITLAGPKLRPVTALAVHPAGFADDPTNPSFHAAIAKRDLAACASCHTEQQCITCHSAINPHGPDFWGRCAALRSRNEQSCLKCHASSGGNWRLLCQ